MSERERWTVYPLLFLTLGIALKDKLFNEVNVRDIRCKSMVCSALVVDDPRAHGQVKLPTGTVQCKNLAATAAVQTQNVVCKLLVVPDRQGKKQAVVSTNEAGGFVEVVGNTNGVSTFLGNTDQVAGLMFIDPQGTVHPRELFSPPIVPKPAAPEEPTPKDGADAPPKTDQDKTDQDETPPDSLPAPEVMPQRPPAEEQDQPRS